MIYCGKCRAGFQAVCYNGCTITLPIVLLTRACTRYPLLTMLYVLCTSMCFHWLVKSDADQANSMPCMFCSSLLSAPCSYALDEQAQTLLHQLDSCCSIKIQLYKTLYLSFHNPLLLALVALMHACQAVRTQKDVLHQLCDTWCCCYAPASSAI